MLNKLLLSSALALASVSAFAQAPAAVKAPTTDAAPALSEAEKAQQAYTALSHSFIQTCSDIAGAYEAAIYPTASAIAKKLKMPRAEVNEALAELTVKSDKLYDAIARTSSALVLTSSIPLETLKKDAGFDAHVKFLETIQPVCNQGRIELNRLGEATLKKAEAQVSWTLGTPLMDQANRLMKSVIADHSKSFPVLSKVDVSEWVLAAPESYAFDAWPVAVLAKDQADQAARDATMKKLETAEQKPAVKK